MYTTHRQMLNIGVIFTCLFSNMTYAEKINTESKIDAVTIFPDRALVHRVSTATLIPQGQSTLIIGNLSTHTLADTMRVKGDSNADVTIVSMEMVRIPMQQLTHTRERQLTQELTALNDQKRTLNDQIKTLQTRLHFISAIGKDLPNTINQELVRGMVNPQAWEQAWQTLEFGTHSTYEGMQNAEIEIRGLDEKILHIQKQLAQIHTGDKEELQAHIVIDAEHAGNITLQLDYQVFGASWTPLYDARLNTETGKMNLIQLAQVQQNSGENWDQVTLTLSTARPAQGGKMPDLHPWWINFASTYQQEDRAQVMKMRRKESKLEADMHGMSMEQAAPMASAPARIRQAQIIASEFAAEYKIPSRVNIPADGAPHKYTVKSYLLNTQLSVKTTPKLAALAYLYTTTTYHGEAPLLPGKTALYRDDAFISHTNITALKPGEKLSLSFGTDDKVGVKYFQMKGEQGEQGMINKDRRVEHQYKITIANHHARKIPITVLEQIPVAQHEDIDVTLLKTDTPPTETDVDNKKGVVAWTNNYAAGEKRDILFGYSVTYPIDQRVHGF